MRSTQSKAFISEHTNIDKRHKLKKKTKYVSDSPRSWNTRKRGTATTTNLTVIHQVSNCKMKHPRYPGVTITNALFTPGTFHGKIEDTLLRYSLLLKS